MARSKYIYAVMTAGRLIAAFTVKHELVSWCKLHRSARRWAEVFRISDGGANEDPNPIGWVAGFADEPQKEED